jgi:hypothetical protein
MDARKECISLRPETLFLIKGYACSALVIGCAMGCCSIQPLRQRQSELFDMVIEHTMA